MKYYVDIVYIMIVNGIIISNDKNKNIIGKGLKIVKKHLDYQMSKKQMV